MKYIVLLVKGLCQAEFLHPKRAIPESETVVCRPERIRLLVAFANGDSNAYGQPAVQYGTAENEHYPRRQWH